MLDSRTRQPLFRKAGKSVANQTEPVPPNANTQLDTIDDNGHAASNDGPPAKKPRHGMVDNASYKDDSELAQSLCLALSQAGTRIKTMGMPGWWSDIERFRPKGGSLHDTDAALCVEELDESCERYSTSLVYRASMTWIIRCFLEIIRRVFHRRSRANAKKHGEDKANREQRYRVGELIIAITKPLHARYGRKAYTLYALLAGQSLSMIRSQSTMTLIQQSDGEFRSQGGLLEKIFQATNAPTSVPNRDNSSHIGV